MTVSFAGLPNPAAPALAFQAGLEDGRAQREKRELRGALARFSANPDDTGALSEVLARNPDLGLKLSEYQDKRMFRGALSDYLAGNGMVGGSAPMQPTRPGVPMGSVPALVPPVRPGASFGEAFEPSRQEIQTAAPEQPPAPDIAPDLSAVLGEPQTKRDHAFLKMLKSDPVQALKIQSTLRENFVDRLKGEHDFYGMAVEELGRVTDETGWQAGLQRLRPLAQALGSDLSTVPATYPGPEGVKQLMESALPTKERLDYLMRAANTDVDNERADRNTDSMIETREQRVGEYRRNNRERTANQRRGQDLTDKRVSTGAGRRRGPARPTATDAKGNKVEWTGKGWVPAK